MIEIREVKTRSELKKFVDYPNLLYKDVPQFVPAFFSDDVDDWDPKKNPAFDYCEAKCWMAWRNGEIVGRIGAILSHASNEKWNTRRMRFSQVDFIDDPEVSAALFKTVEDWAHEKGCDEVHGPLGFSDMDREGMLVEGFDRRSMFITYYNHPYYNEHLERLGYGKDVDWLEKMIDIPYDEHFVSRLQKLSDRVQRMSGLRVAKVKSRLHLLPLVKKVFALANEAYAVLYGTVPFNDKQIKRYTLKFLPILDPKLTCFLLDEQDNLIAFGISAPSMAEAMKKCRGRLFPFGFVHVLKALKSNDTLDLFLIAVRPDCQNSGVNAIIMNHILKGCHQMGITKAETGPTLETNHKIQSQWNFFKTEQHKRRRCYVKKI